MAAGIFSFDWMLFGSAKGIFRSYFALSTGKRVAFLFALIMVPVVVVGFVAGAIWLAKFMPTWLKIAVPIVMGIFSLSFLISPILGARHCVRDWMVFRKIVITGHMSRADVARVLDSVEWPVLRLALVRRLALSKTIVTGEWPAMFKLSVSSDPAITELAKLEERWLKLDR